MNKVAMKVMTAAMACCALVGSGLAHAAEVSQHTFRIAFANGEGNPQYDGAKKLAEVMAEKSGGKFTLKLFPNATLGKDVAVVSSMQGGVIDMAIMNTNLMVGVAKEAGLLDLPYLFDSPKQAYAVLDGPVGAKIHAAFEPKGLVGLGYFGMGYYHMHSNKKPFNRVEDFEGQKLRVTETPINIDFVKAMGGNAVPMPYLEIYTAMEQGVVDGASQPLINLQYAKFYEVQKYLSLTYNSYTPQSVLFSKKVWDKLSADEKKIVRDSVKVAQDYQRQVSEKKEAEALVFLKTKMTVNEVPAAEIARMRERTKPMVEKYSAQYGEDLAKEMFAEIAKARGAKK